MFSVCKGINEAVCGKQVKVPMFQRTYQWSSDEVIQLIEDLMSVRFGMFLGNIILGGDTEEITVKTNYSIIDGQQRLMTLAIIAKAMSVEATLRPEEIKLEEQLSEFAKWIMSGKFSPHQEDAECYRQVICGEGNKAHGRIQQNYMVAKAYLGANLTVEDCLRINTTFESARFNVLTLCSDEDFQGVFASVNGSGKRLTEVELIRNVDLMSHDGETAQMCYKKFWSKLSKIAEDLKRDEGYVLGIILSVSGLLTRRLELSEEGALTSAYKQVSREASSNKLALEKVLIEKLADFIRVGELPVSESLEKLLLMADMLGCPELQEIIFAERVFNINGGEARLASMEKTIEILVSWCSRAFVLGWSNEDISSTLRSVSDLIATTRSERPVTMEAMQSDLAVTLFYGKDTSGLKNGLAEGIISGSIHRSQQISYMLKCAELKLCRKDINFDNANVEKLIDRDNSNLKNMSVDANGEGRTCWDAYLRANGWNGVEQYLTQYGNGIVNYILVEEAFDFDSEYKESCFDRLHKSRFSLTRGAKRNDWTPDTIAQRQALLVKLFNTIWAVPKIEADSINRIYGKEPVGLNQICTVKGLKPKYLRVGETVYQGSIITSLAKNWRTFAWLTVKCIIDSKDIELYDKDLAKLNDKKLWIHGSPMFASAEECQEAENPDIYTQVGHGIYFLPEKSPDKIIKQLQNIVNILGCENQVQVRFA